MPTITHDSASRRVSVQPTDRTYHGRPLAIVHDLDERGEQTDTGYIVALTPHCVAIADEDREIAFGDAVLGDLRRGEWLANWGGPSDAYDEPERWIAHHADLGDALDLCERFAELLRRNVGAMNPPLNIGALCDAVTSSQSAAPRLTTPEDAILWLAGSLPGLDAYHDLGRVILFRAEAILTPPQEPTP